MSQYTIGFSNLSEASPFSIAVREGLEAAAAQYPDIRLVMRNNELDDACALQNARDFRNIPVDLAIVYHINQRIQRDLYAALFPIPVICVDIPIAMTTFFGVNNTQIGFDLGQELVRDVQARWDGQIDKILAIVDSRVVEVVGQRTTGIIDLLQQEFGMNDDNILMVDGLSDRETIIRLIDPILTRWQPYRRIVGIGYNADTTMALIEAIRAHGKTEDFLVVGQGGDQATTEELMRPDSPLVATTNFRPELYGEQLIDLARRKLAGERLPQYNYANVELLTRV